MNTDRTIARLVWGFTAWLTVKRGWLITASTNVTYFIIMIAIFLCVEIIPIVFSLQVTNLSSLSDKDDQLVSSVTDNDGDGMYSRVDSNQNFFPPHIIQMGFLRHSDDSLIASFEDDSASRTSDSMVTAETGPQYVDMAEDVDGIDTDEDYDGSLSTTYSSSNDDVFSHYNATEDFAVLKWLQGIN